ncbi:MAG: hypothetical protein R3F29_00680 [Planctomycetota bacterium]
MSTQPTSHPDDATLVAWLDDELLPDERAAVADAVAADPALGQRVALLRAARAELAWALGDDAGAAPPQAAPARRRRPQLALWSLAAAALVVVVAIARAGRDGQQVAAENDFVALRLSAPKPGWDLFSDVHFELRGQSRTARPCQVVARRGDEDDAAAVARAVGAAGGQDFVPLIVDAEIEGPGGRLLARRCGAGATFSAQGDTLRLPLIDLRVRYDGVAPLLTVKLEPDGASEDFEWGLRHGVSPQRGGELGFVPEEIGEYRLQLRVRALPRVPGDAPAFAEPLLLAIGFAVRGVVGPWSEPVDGLRARTVAARSACEAGAPLAFAVQLRNDSDRDRAFNVTGSTMAKIPQPFHFDLLLDGRQATQREDLGVMTAARTLFQPMPVGTMRSLIVLADYWRLDGAAPSELHGEHTLGVRFHFEPSVWQNGDRELWMGKIDAPPVSVRFD